MRLDVHRYAMLGVLDERGYPVTEMGVLEIPEHDRREDESARYRVLPGKQCKECGNFLPAALSPGSAAQESARERAEIGRPHSHLAAQSSCRAGGMSPKSI